MKELPASNLVNFVDTVADIRQIDFPPRGPGPTEIYDEIRRQIYEAVSGVSPEVLAQASKMGLTRG